MESHLRREHAIDVVLPRGMRIEEEEGIPGACFNSYERQRSLKRFMDPEIKYYRNRQKYIRKLKVRAVSKYNSIPAELRLDTQAEFVARFMDKEMTIYDSNKDERLEMLTKKIAAGLDSYVSMSEDFISDCWRVYWQNSDNKMCLIVVKQCKKAGISTQPQGVSTDVDESQNPSEGGVSTPPRRRRPKMPIRRKEVESNTDVVSLTSDSDDAASDVAIVQIQHGKGIRLWIQTPNKHFSR